MIFSKSTKRLVWSAVIITAVIVVVFWSRTWANNLFPYFTPLSNFIPSKILSRTSRQVSLTAFDSKLVQAGLTSVRRSKSIPSCGNGVLVTSGPSVKTFTYSNNQTAQEVTRKITAVKQILQDNLWGGCYDAASSKTYTKNGKILGLSWTGTSVSVQYEY